MLGTRNLMRPPFSAHPIGIFDSGIGGLTVARAVIDRLPQEHLIYFGDTAHFPYGDKSAHALQGYTLKIAEHLLARNCKLILIACNSASAAAYDAIKTFVGNDAIVMNVIDPVVNHLHHTAAGKRIGLIGTRQTVNSHVYQNKLTALGNSLELHCHATNLLASAIEEFGDHGVTDTLLHAYLTHANLQNIDALVLACTHYPIIKHRIAALLNDRVTLIDPSDIVAATVERTLIQHNLLHTTAGMSPGQKHFYVSDEYTDAFVASTRLFFKETIHLEHCPLEISTVTA